MFWKKYPYRSDESKQSHPGPHRGQTHSQQQPRSHQLQFKPGSAHPSGPSVLGQRNVAEQKEMDRLVNDADIAAEEAAKVSLQNGQKSLKLSEANKFGLDDFEFLPLNVRNHSHTASKGTAQLVAAAGGLPMLRRFTSLFYEKAFLDPHLDQFIRDHSDPHVRAIAACLPSIRFHEP
eukprot:6182869-Pleurochrysis_carterae.AAC.5